MQSKCNIFNRYMRWYTSGCAFIFLLFSLILPSGYFYGPVLLMLGSITLFWCRHLINLNRSDWMVIFLLLFYFFIGAAINYFHSLPLNNYDKLSRFLFSIPVLLLLIVYPPKVSFFIVGAALGGCLSGIYAVWQIAFQGMLRASGNTNPIQFGDISLLLGFISLTGLFLSTFETHQKKVFLIIGFFMGFIAFLLSGTRGGFLAIFFILIFFSRYLYAKCRKHYILTILICISSFFLLIPAGKTIESRLGSTFDEVKNFSKRNSEPTALSMRLQLWDAGLHAFWVKPILGWGNLDNIKVEFKDDWERLNEWDDFNHLHNEYIDTLAKKGLIGFVALLFIFLFPLRYFYWNMKNFHGDVKVLSILGFCLIISIMSFGFTQVFMAHSNGVTIYIFLLIIIFSLTRKLG